jgi:hypothetical protein
MPRGWSQPPLLREEESLRFGTFFEMSEKGCWDWLGHNNGQGYGVFVLDRSRNDEHRRQQYAHRIMYRGVHGLIPEGFVVDHLCDNPLCVNPDHLKAVAHSENIRRALTKRTHCPKGHAYTPENTYISPQGHRQCRECKRANGRRMNKRRAAAFAARHKEAAQLGVR